MRNSSNEIIYNNAKQVSEDLERLKRLGIESPPLDWSKAIRIGNAVFFPKNQKRREAILKRYEKIR